MQDPFYSPEEIERIAKVGTFEYPADLRKFDGCGLVPHSDYMRRLFRPLTSIRFGHIVLDAEGAWRATENSLRQKRIDYRKIWRCWLGSHSVRRNEESRKLPSVIIPAFNEEDNIVNCVSELADALSSPQRASRFLVVNDGSTDRTLQPSSSLSKSCDFVRTITWGGTLANQPLSKKGLRRARAT